MDLIYALLIALGLRHDAPRAFHAPVKTLPLIIETPSDVLYEQHWGPGR